MPYDPKMKIHLNQDNIIKQGSQAEMQFDLHIMLGKVMKYENPRISNLKIPETSPWALT